MDTRSKIPEKTLLIIGAGPKALALAAKAYVLTKLHFDVSRIVILEKEDIGAYWGGKSGFTDGTQSLRRCMERDIGFPYSTSIWPGYESRINEEMLAFSWARYLAVTGEYAHWVDSGMPLVNHQEFHKYLHWIAKETQIEPIYGTATNIELQDNRWLVTYRTQTDGYASLPCDGVVITGPGAPKPLHAELTPDVGYLDSISFWKEWPEIQKKHKEMKTQQTFGIIGAGDAAAAIVEAIVKKLRTDYYIEIISRSGTVFSRGESYSETLMYSDPSGWPDFSESHRREFIRRTDRAVFAQETQHIISTASHVQVIPGEVRVPEGISIEESSIWAEIKYKNDAPQRKGYNYLINSVSFNATAFLELLEEAVRKQLLEEAVRKQLLEEAVRKQLLDDIRNGQLSSKAAVSALEPLIDSDLSVRGWEPLLHLPMLAGPFQGPGFPNLACLGLLSDRILFSYVKAPST